LRVAVSAVLLLICFYHVDWHDLARSLSEIDPWYIVLALILNAIGTVLVRAWIAHVTTQASGLVLGFVDLVRINLIARFYTIVLPRGGATAIRWHHYRKGGDGHAAAALLLFENLVSVLTLFLSAALVLLAEYRSGGAMAEILLPVCWIGVAVSVAVLLPFLHVRSANAFRRLMTPLLSKPGWISDRLGMLVTAVFDYHALPARKVGTIFFASALGYVFFVLSAWVLAEGMGLGVGFAAIAWVRSVTLLVALVPITIAGIGLRESMLIMLLRDYGVSPSVAFAYASASFSIQLLLGIVGAALEAGRIFGSRGARSAKESGGWPS
jgi:hypothetical protein